MDCIVVMVDVFLEEQLVKLVTQHWFAIIVCPILASITSALYPTAKVKVLSVPVVMNVEKDSSVLLVNVSP